MHWTQRLERAAKLAVRDTICSDEGGTTTKRMQWEFGDVFRGKWLRLTPPYGAAYPERPKKAGEPPTGDSLP